MVRGHDLLGRSAQARAVRDEEPAELDRHGRERHHLPVDERHPAVIERRDVRELEVAVQAGARQAAERGEQRRRIRREALDQVARGRGRPPVEGVPALEEPVADREPLGPIAARRMAVTAGADAPGGDTTASPSRRSSLGSRPTASRAGARRHRGRGRASRPSTASSQARSSPDRSGMRMAIASPAEPMPR